jgi:hypothetical protein
MKNKELKKQIKASKLSKEVRKAIIVAVELERPPIRMITWKIRK